MTIGEELAVSPAAFERHLRYFSKKGYRFLTLSELYDHWEELHRCRKRLVVLTFDDGYRDNYECLFPLLEKYEARATIFVSAGFVDPDPATRPGRFEGYLSEPEIKEMQASGRVEFQAHGVTHGRVFSSTRRCGVQERERRNAWLQWEAEPEHRTRWWTRPMPEALVGMTLYTQAPALTARKYIPGSETVFGRFESADEFRDRVAAELDASKSWLAAILGTPVRFFCWPENAYTQEGLELARQSGFAATVSNHFLTVNGRYDSRETIGRRYIGQYAFGLQCETLDYLAFVCTLKVAEGWHLWYPPLALAGLLRRRLNKQLRPRTAFPHLRPLPATERQSGEAPVVNQSDGCDNQRSRIPYPSR
jgi:peptidoglycan/xylan/chitin deacetylase (PgdA/CDA1 family)